MGIVDFYLLLVGIEGSVDFFLLLVGEFMEFLHLLEWQGAFVMLLNCFLNLDFYLFVGDTGFVVSLSCLVVLSFIVFKFVSVVVGF